MRTRTLAPLVCGFMGLLALPVESQTVRPVIGGGLVFQTYRFSNADAAGVESLTLVTAPVAFRAPIGRTLALEVSGAFARGTLTRSDGSEAALSGLTDTQVTLSAAVVPERVTFSAIALVPMGRQKLTNDEADVAGAISADLLPFRISNWSTGGGVGMSSGFAHSTGKVGLGVSVSYVVGREFDLLEEEEFAYRPGNQLSVRGVMDVAVGTAGKLSAQLTFLKASEDQVNGSNLFRPGSRLHGMVSYTFRAGASASGVLYGGMLHRESGAYLLESTLKPSAEDLLLAGSGLGLPVGGMVLRPSVDLRIVRRADGTGQGYLAGAGASFERGRVGGFTLVPSVRGRFGNLLVREGVETGFTGLDFALILRFGGAS